MEKNLAILNLIECQLMSYTYEARQDYLDYVNNLINGGSNLPSRVKLFEDAYNGPGEGLIVELGSFYGGSLIPLAAGSKMAGREKVVSIDIMTSLLIPTTMFSEAQLHQSPAFAGRFLRNLIICGVRDWVIPIFQDSQVVAPLINQPIRLLHVDGAHNKDGVTFDLEHYASLLIPGGIIHCHDYESEPVTSVVNEYIRDSGKFIDCEIIAPEIEQTQSFRCAKKCK